MKIIPKRFIKILCANGEKCTFQVDDKGIINNLSNNEKNWTIGWHINEVRLYI